MIIERGRHQKRTFEKGEKDSDKCSKDKIFLSYPYAIVTKTTQTTQTRKMVSNT